MKLVSLVILFVVSSAGYSQFYKPTSLTLNTRGGYLIAHRAVMSHLVQANNYGFELEINKQRGQNEEEKVFQDLFGSPLSGISIIYQDFGYSSVLGQGIGIYQHYTQPVIFDGKNALDVKFGSGVAVLTKKYKPIDNPKNNAIGSHINSVIDIRMSYKRYWKKWHMGLGIGISHFSNAAVVMPNLGLNTPYLDFSIGYNFEERLDPPKTTQEVKDKYKRLPTTLSFSLIGTTRQNLAGHELPKFYGVFVFRPYTSIGIGKRMRLDLGTELIYNEANRHKVDDVTVPVGQNFQLGFYAGPVFRIYKTEIYIHIGAYALNQGNPSGWVYNRIGYRYLFTKNFYGIVNIKAHLGKADYVEFGVGYRLWEKDQKIAAD